jgi:hypothetical protein
MTAQDEASPLAAQELILQLKCIETELIRDTSFHVED